MRPRLTVASSVDERAPDLEVAHGRAALILVAGHSRGVGKTATIEEILRAQRNGRWAAVKVSAHRHCDPRESRPLIERDITIDAATQTGRYLIAGAERAYLCRTPSSQLAATARFIRGLRESGFNVIVESNRIVDFVEPDVVVFAVAPRIADWKASSGVVLPRTHAFVVRDRDAAAAWEFVHGLELKGRLGFAAGHDAEDQRLQSWLAGRLWHDRPRLVRAIH
jgi:hypothetical protein